MAKKILADETVENIIENIKDMDRDQAIDFIERSEGVKESSAKRYLRYIKGYVKRQREREEEKEAEPSFFKVVPREKVVRRKSATSALKGLLKFRLHYTHTWLFICQVISPRRGIVKPMRTQHHFSYTSHSFHTDRKTALKRHFEVYGENHQVEHLEHVRTYRPSFT